MRTDTPVMIKLADYAPFPFAIEQVEMLFDLSATATRVRTRLQVQRLSSGEFILDGVDLTLNRIALNGDNLGPEAYTKTDETLTLHDVPDRFDLEINVTIDPSSNTALSGLYISGGRFCTQCESVGFRRITYWPDRPDVMSRYKVRIEADAAEYPILLSNGTPGATGELKDGRHFAEWDDPHPKPSYLFALCAGDYDVFRDTFTTRSGAPVDLAIHVDKGDAERAAWAMESLKASMTWDEEVFGREYDLGVFNIVAVRDFNFGAMENKGLNIFNSAYVLADEATATDADFEAIESIVGHEYFHNWTGNRITCRDWFQLCLKEGLTVFRDQEFSADMRSRPVQRIKDVIRLRARQFPEDGGPLAHAVRPDRYASIDNLYTATVYEKGAELIRMLKTLIGEAAFARGMDLYFDRHDGEATTIEVFYDCFETASGQDLSDFRRWYSQPGTPTLTVDEAWDEATGQLTVTLLQSNPVTPQNDAPEPLPMPIRAAVFSAKGQKIKEETLLVDGAKTVWTISDLAERPLVSLNRGFSAPIYLKQAYSDNDKLALAKMEDDAFNRWEIFQTLTTQHVLQITSDTAAAVNVGLAEAMIEAALEEAQSDPAFAALLLRVPTTSELFAQQSPADPAALEHARNRFRTELAARLAPHMDAILARKQPEVFRPDAQQSGERALRGAVVHLMAMTADAGRAEQLVSLFRTAPNMTESLSTLRALCELGGVAKADALSQFAETWGHNPLVMDKWFSVQAATGNVETIKTLIEHRDFDLGNPNRVRSVIGVFAMQNLPAFHAKDGSGYAIVTEMIGRADRRNPALAARLLTAFDQWRALEPVAQAEAQQALKALQKKTLSKNASDIIERTLA